ncbi:hypothetical protein HZH68_001503 [Vespula germanica]|nr:hypothetical protein HZH66_001367 [Vespula vulgaris]KAF7418850.1 hypothetical protein HZH68_001503 [Vespula germanica]
MVKAGIMEEIRENEDERRYGATKIGPARSNSSGTDVSGSGSGGGWKVNEVYTGQLFPVLAKLEFEASQTTWTPVRDMKALREVARNTPPRKYLTGENVGGGRGLVVDGGSSGGSAAGNKFWEMSRGTRRTLQTLKGTREWSRNSN